MPKLESDDIGRYWIEWIITYSLMREAKTLIEGKAASEADAFRAKE